MEQGKVCTKCGEFKSFNEFAKNSRNKTDGRQPKCKVCNKKYRLENVEKRKEYDKKYTKRNSEYVRERKKKWHEMNIERIKENKKKYYQENKEYIQNKTKKWRSDNPLRYREQMKIRREQNPEYMIHWREKNTNRIIEYNKRIYWGNVEMFRKRAREFAKTARGREISFKSRMKRKSYKHKVYFTLFERKQILNRDNWNCQCCGIKVHDRSTGYWNTPDKAHIDHIIPISKGGNSEPDNLQVLCRTCNLTKKDKIEYIKQAK